MASSIVFLFVLNEGYGSLFVRASAVTSSVPQGMSVSTFSSISLRTSICLERSVHGIFRHSNACLIVLVQPRSVRLCSAKTLEDFAQIDHLLPALMNSLSADDSDTVVCLLLSQEIAAPLSMST